MWPSGNSLILALQLLSKRILSLPEPKKIFFTTLLFLTEKSTDSEVLTEVTGIVGEWITGEHSQAY